MAIVLFVMGLLVTAAGFVTIGFGIPINAFSLGNTLIIAGTITVATGLILVGLAAAIGQLRRIAQALNARPAVRSAARTIETADVAVPTAKVTPAVVPTRAPQPPEVREVPETLLPDPVQSEPRSAAAAARPPGPLDWLRARPKGLSPAAPVSGSAPPPSPAMSSPPENPAVEDETPLSPRPPPRQAPAPAVEPTLEPKVWSPARNGSAEPRPAPRVEQPMPRATPQVEPPNSKDDFDLVWPDRGAPEPAKREEIARREPEMPRPPLPPRRPFTPRPQADRGPAILKSGVIDGMPYTLYADGSIEAELSQGTVKFASVDALRAHLEKG